MRRTLLAPLFLATLALLAPPARAADSGSTPADQKLSYRIELFGGGHYFVDGTNLGVAAAPDASAGAKSNAMLGLRAAFGLGFWAAAEVECFGMRTPDRTYQRKADILGYRLNLLAFLLPGNLRPFMLVGGGAIEVAATHAEGNAGLVRDLDAEFHVGVGLDYRPHPHISVRADGRTVQMPGKRAWSLASDFEATLGVAFLFGAVPEAPSSSEVRPAAALPVLSEPTKPSAGVERSATAAAAPALSPPAPAKPAPAAPVPTPPAPAPAFAAAPVSPPSPVAAAPTALPPAAPTPALAPPSGRPPVSAAREDLPTLKELLGRGKEIRFEGSGSKLSLTSLALIGQLAEALVKDPSIQLEIVSHTGGSGDAAKDMALSKRRANAVRNALVDREVNGSRLTATGRGSEAPLAPNITRSGRKMNERVELRLQGGDRPSR